MQKGKGATSMLGGAFDQDLDTVNREEGRSRNHRGRKASPGVEQAKPEQAKIHRLNITLADDILKRADLEVFTRKQAGESISRSALIEEALRNLLK